MFNKRIDTNINFILLLLIELLVLITLISNNNILLALAMSLTIILTIYIIKKNNYLKKLYENESQKLEKTKIKLNEFDRIIRENTLFSITDRYWNIENVSDSFEKLSGYSKEELIGQRHLIIQRKDQTDEFYTPIINTIYQNKTWKGKFTNYTKDGKKYCTQTNILSLRDEKEEITGFMTSSKLIECD